MGFGEDWTMNIAEGDRQVLHSEALNNEEDPSIFFLSFFLYLPPSFRFFFFGTNTRVFNFFSFILVDIGFLGFFFKPF
jgi:hypothetical protein